MNIPNQAAEHYYLITDTMKEVDPSWPVVVLGDLEPFDIFAISYVYYDVSRKIPQTMRISVRRETD